MSYWWLLGVVVLILIVQCMVVNYFVSKYTAKVIAEIDKTIEDIRNMGRDE